MKRAVALLLSASVGASATGCLAHDPALGVAPNGVQPHVAVDVEIRDIVVTDHTGTAVTTDKDGKVISRTETTSSRVVGRERYIAGFDYLRGNERLDEQDFYHLVGDQVAVATIAAERERGIFYNHLGLGILVVGLIAGVGVAVGSGVARSASGTVFSIALPLGGIMSFYGSSMVTSRQLPMERALSAVGQPMPELGPVDSVEAPR